MAAPFSVIGALRTRAAERYIRPLLHPEGRTILGFHGPAIPFWELHGDRPSMALVPARPVVAISADGRGLRCRFRWGNVFVDLPLLDRTYRPNLMAGLASGWRTLGGAALADVIGFTPQRLLVSLTHPKDGHCYKVVTALL